MAKHQTHHRTQEASESPVVDNSALSVSDSEKNPSSGEAKRATEPWNPESDPNHPVRRGTLGLNKIHKGYQARWVQESAVDRRKAQGYEMANASTYEMEETDGRIKRKELVLMEIPVEEHQKNRANVNRLTEERAKAARTDYEREGNEISRQTGGGIRTTNEQGE